jgi:predicted nucleic acid-binding protein
MNFRKNEVRFIAPDFFWAEFGNVLWKAVRLGRIEPKDPKDAIRRLRGWGIGSTPSENLLDLAFTIATSHQRTVYDSLYVALALRSRCELITADERLVNAMGARYPVRWLGSHL